MRLIVASILVMTALAGCASVDEAPTLTEDQPATGGFEPHVLVGVPDSGINPYHMMYYREARTEHPCTYIEAFPCDIPALNLSVGPMALDWQQRFDADADTWANVTDGQWYWIPQTVFVAASGFGCDGICILDDNGMHGTGTTSSVVSENPDVLIAFKEGSSDITPMLEAGLPVDIFSVSWGYIAPVPVNVEGVLDNRLSPLYFKASGNDPRPGHSDAWTGSPYVISVGGAYSADQSEELMAAKQSDIVSFYCRETAQTKSVDEMRASYCGTSFATPTAAGAASKVVLALRQTSGYTGALQDGMVDPILGITVQMFRDAINRTASYDPEPTQPHTGEPTSVPLNPAAPWAQWGWGFYDGLVANATIDHFLVEEAPAKPMAAVAYMDALYQGRQLLHG